MRHLLRRDLLSYALVGLAVCLTVVASLQLAPLFGFQGLPGTVINGADNVALPQSAEKQQVASSRSGADQSTAVREQARTPAAAGGAGQSTASTGAGAGSGVRSNRQSTEGVSGGSTTPSGGGSTTTTPGSSSTTAPATGTPTTGESSTPAADSTSMPSTVVASAGRSLRLSLVSVARIAAVDDSPSSKTTTQGSVALRFAVADASGSAAEGVPAGVSVNVAIPATPDQAPDSEALRVQVEMLDPSAAAASGTDTPPAGVDDVSLRVRLALSDAKLDDPVFTQAPAATDGVSNTVNVWVPLDANGKGDADPVKPVETQAAPASGDGGHPAADTAAQAEVVVPMTTGEGAPASSTQTVPLPVTDQTSPAGGPTADNATPIVLQVESATEPPAEPPAAPQPSEEEPAQKPEPAAAPQPTAPHDDDADDDDDCKHDRDHAAKSDASADTGATAAADAVKVTAQQSDDDDD